MKTKRWLKGLLSAFIHGASSAALSWSGLAAAHGVGLDVPVLNWKGLGIVLVSGGLPQLFHYLSDHPIPDDETEVITKK